VKAEAPAGRNSARPWALDPGGTPCDSAGSPRRFRLTPPRLGERDQTPRHGHEMFESPMVIVRKAEGSPPSNMHPGRSAALSVGLVSASLLDPGGFEDNGWLEAYCPRRGSSNRVVPSGTEECIWSRHGSRTHPGAALPRRSLLTARPACPLRGEHCDGANKGNLGSPPLSLAFTSSGVAVTGAEDHGRLRPAPGGIGAINPSRLRAAVALQPGANRGGSERSPGGRFAAFPFV